MLAYYPAAGVTISGLRKRFVRVAATGSDFETYFCPDCGSTVYAVTAKHPDMLGIPVGAIADPAYPPPIRSVWEQTKHPWVVLEGVQHFPQGRS